MFCISPEAVLYDMSYANCIMYSKACPQPFDKGEDKPIFDESKDACNVIATDADLGAVTVRNIKKQLKK